MLSVLFQGTGLDIYIHWLILVLGSLVFLSGTAVLTSCRSVAGIFKLSDSSGFYRSYYRLHHIFWIIFWYALGFHLLITIIHVGIPSPVEAYLVPHQVSFYSAITNLLLVFGILFSCRSFLNVLKFFLPKSPLSFKWYNKLYKYHYVLWWLLGISVSGHIVFGMIHAVNT